jgi:hypothetical protein
MDVLGVSLNFRRNGFFVADRILSWIGTRSAGGVDMVSNYKNLSTGVSFRPKASATPLKVTSPLMTFAPL